MTDPRYPDPLRPDDTDREPPKARRNWRCVLGGHDFRWPPHSSPWQLWEDYYVECARGCGARTRLRCRRDEHWTDKHPSTVR